MARLAAYLVLALVFAAHQAPAQEARRGQTVEDRARPDYDAPGLRTGAFLLYPSLDVGLAYNDNILAEDANETDDLIGIFKPRVQLDSDWSRHALQLSAEGRIGRYDDNDSEDYEDWLLGVDGRLDVGLSRFNLVAGYDSLHEERTSPDDRDGAEPTEYTDQNLALSWTMLLNRVLVRPLLGYRALDYDSTPRASGIPVNNDDRDRDQLRAGLRVGYELSPDYAFFVQGQVDEIDYDLRFDNGGFQRSSDGAEIVFGSTLDFSGVTFGEVFIGYRERDYDDPRFEQVDGFIFGGDVAWNITTLTTLRFLGSRTIEGTTLIGASGREDTRFEFEADHELLRNLILSLDVALTNQDFQGIDREDDITTFGLGARYLVNRNLEVRLAYARQERDSSPAGAGLEFTINTFLVSLQGRF